MIDMSLDQILVFTTWRNIKNWYKNNKFKISDKFELPDGSYSTLDIQGYFEHIT